MIITDKSKKPVILSEFGGYAYPVKGHIFNPNHSYGYRSYTTQEELQRHIQMLYRKKVIPAIGRGLCGAIYTQVSDVEDEINGLLTYDRKVCKADAQTMTRLAAQLQCEILK